MLVVTPNSPQAEAIITVDKVYGAMARVTVLPKVHSEEVIKMLRKELETCEAHERMLVHAFIRYITVEGNQ